METSTRTITRFAPSPTGSLHIGGAHTALFNYLWAKHNNGTFILRFEDTDTVRSSVVYEESILQDMRWLGMAPDENPTRQTERGARYAEVLAELRSRSVAYPCFCSNTDSTEPQSVSTRDRCRNLSPSERERRISAGEAHCWRFAAPELAGGITFNDRLRGRLTVQTDSIGDFVLARSDASYTYLFAVVVDDHDSNISHVIRGEEHLSNVPKQELIYRALGWEAPEWVHIPMILDRERHKLSKRSGAISIGSYRESGWSPEALTSYLATLSWSYAPTDRISDPMELSRVFDLDSVALVSPVHDEERMRYFGRLSVASTPIETLLDECLDILILNTGITNGLGPEMLLLIEELRPLCATTEELKLAIASALATPEHDEGQLEEPKWMPALAERLANLPNTNWTFENVKSCIKAFQTELAIKGRDFYHTLRLKITGREDGAPLALIISCLGKNIAIERILRR